MAPPLKPFATRRSNLAFYLKCAVCILIIYYLNLLFGLKYYIWTERSFEEQYSLTMIHIDATKIEDNPEQFLGPTTNNLPNRFIIDNEYFCGRSLDPQTRLTPHVLILVKSLPENIQQREAIRSTWGNKSRLENVACRLAFVLGTDTHNTSVDGEARTYGDIIQIDKDDYYYYSSYKMIMMLRWITDYCTSKSRRAAYLDLRNYVLFVNDDYYVDIDVLLLYLRRIDEDPDMTTYERRTFITGELIEGARPHRSASDRDYVSLTDYPYDQYPSYISSECFLMTRYNARLFYIASKYIRLFQFDQIYMGLTAYSMSISLLPNNDLFPISVDQTKSASRWKTMFHKKSNSSTATKPICLRGYSAQKLLKMWNGLQ